LSGQPSVSSLIAQAQAAQAAGQLAEAERLYRAALVRDARQPAVLYALAGVLEDAKRPEAAIAALQEALRYAPDHPQTLQYLGILLADTKRNDEAIQHLRRAVTVKPDYARAWHNLGNVLRSVGRTVEAIDASNAAIRYQRDYALAYFNLSGALRDQGRFAEAERALRESLRLQPQHRESWSALGAVLRQQQRLAEAAQVYRQVIALAPDNSASPLSILAPILVECGKREEAKRLCQQALARTPNVLRLALPAHLSLSPVYANRDALVAARAEYAAGLKQLRAAIPAFAAADVDDTLDAAIWSNFYLAYHGEDDRDLQTQYADFVGELLDRLLPEFRHPLPAPEVQGRRIRIGFASSFFYDCTAGVYFRSWITALDRSRFEIYVYHFRPGMSPVAEELAAYVPVFCHLPGTRDVRGVAARIRADALDVLVYPELGMDGFCFLLAALRLAPVQCAGWGHPVTSGHATIDYYFSSAIMEPADAQSHYREQLVRLPGIGTAYRPPDLPEFSSAPTMREQLGLPVDRHLYFYPQSLYKIHPDNDALVADLLAADPEGVLVLFQGRDSNVTEQFLRRLSTAFDAKGLDVAARTHVLHYRPRADYLRVNAACDVMLDTLHWSGGNTSLDALACGLPLVTLPGRFMRGRQSYGMLQLLGVPELIASDTDDYLRIALRLVRDRDWRQQIVDRIRANQHRLFDDPAPIAAMQEFYLSLFNRPTA
jgi:protein O-GlcNAc transferase